jgi:hypothetical protein
MFSRNALIVACFGTVLAIGVLIAFAQPRPSQAVPVPRGSGSAAASSNHDLRQVIGGFRFTVLDAHQGVTFRAAKLRSGMTTEEASEFERPGRLPTAYVSITLLVEPTDGGLSSSVQFDDPTWGWPMERQPDGSMTTPFRRTHFKSESLHPGAMRPANDDPFITPEVASKAELKTVRVYGPTLPEGPARFTVGLSRAGAAFGTLIVDDLPLK